MRDWHIPMPGFYAGHMSASVSEAGTVALQRPAPSRSPWRRVRDLLSRSRAWIHRHPRLHAPYRLVVGLTGAAVIVVGLILVPLPGPGWLVVFVGVAVLGTEFPAAHRLSQAVRRSVDRLRRRWQERRVRRTGRPAQTDVTGSAA